MHKKDVHTVNQKKLNYSVIQKYLSNDLDVKNVLKLLFGKETILKFYMSNIGFIFG